MVLAEGIRRDRPRLARAFQGEKRLIHRGAGGAGPPLKRKEMDFNKTYDTSEVAELCHVTRRTVYNWITSGALKAEKVGPTRWIIRGIYLKAFMEKSPSGPGPTPAPAPSVNVPTTSLLNSRPSITPAKKRRR